VHPILLSGLAKVDVSPFKGTAATLDLMAQYALGDEGERSHYVRQWTEGVVRRIAPKDYLSEILALRAWATGPQIRYTNDARHVEQVRTPARSLLELEQTGVATLDCDDIATLLAAMNLQIGREVEFVVVGFKEPGNFSHVFVRVREPKTGRWVVCDPVAGANEAQMLKRVTTWKNRSLDA
jgi:hypothetical protein